MTHEIEWTLTRDDEEIDVTIEYEVAPYYPAQLYGPPEHCSPAEGGEITYLHAVSDAGPIELTAKEQATIEQYIYDHHDYDEQYIYDHHDYDEE